MAKLPDDPSALEGDLSSDGPASGEEADPLAQALLFGFAEAPALPRWWTVALPEVLTPLPLEEALTALVRRHWRLAEAVDLQAELPEDAWSRPPLLELEAVGDRALALLAKLIGGALDLSLPHALSAELTELEAKATAARLALLAELPDVARAATLAWERRHPIDPDRVRSEAEQLLYEEDLPGEITYELPEDPEA